MLLNRHRKTTEPIPEKEKAKPADNKVELPKGNEQPKTAPKKAKK